MKQLFSAHKGRTNRATFFMGIIFWTLMIGAFQIFLDDFKSKGFFENNIYDLLLILSVLVIEIYFIYLGLALWIRRLHDFNRSGWWMVAVIIPFLNSILLVYVLYKAGDNSKNQYGDRPHSVLV